MPVPDNIYDYKQKQAAKKPGEPDKPEAESAYTAGVTAVTYLGETAGNTLEDLLTMSFGTNWKELESEMEAISTGDGGYTSQPFYQKSGAGGKALLDTLKGVSGQEKFRKGLNATEDAFGTTYANFVIGPVNVIDKTITRDRGLKFANDMKLKFEYELKSLSYVNPKIAMIDVISNMLTMTTNNAQFFGGGHRYYGAAGAVANQFGDIAKLRKGDFSGYIGTVVTDVETGMKDKFGTPEGGFSASSVLDGLKGAGKTLLTNMLGGFLSSKVGAVSGVQATKAFLSGEPTGWWHVTIGNPLNPIVMMGNMVCDNATMTLGSGLGYDDFPMEVSFELDVKHGKPRDKGDIENMFNAGRGRIYASAAGANDILNLKGLDVKTYGSVSAGKSQLAKSSVQPNTTNSIPAGAVNNENVSNISAKAVAGQETGNTANGDYFANLTSMVIDS